jgi:hypothetical protein
MDPMRSSKIPAGEYVPTADQRVMFNNVSWSDFEAQLEIRGDRAGPRISYFHGALEIMSPSKNHEQIKSYIPTLDVSSRPLPSRPVSIFRLRRWE